MKLYNLPTGKLIIDNYTAGELETLSIGDYGKHNNVKADFLGYVNEIHGVANGPIMPLSEKWVVTLSTQYGCPMKCNFCDVHNIKFKGNVSFDDLKKQLYNAIGVFPKVKYTERLNVHFARMGDAIFNPDVIDFAIWLYENKLTIKHETGLSIETLHPVFTTMVPRYNLSFDRIFKWVDIKNKCYNGQAGLQLSINSTDETQRNIMFNGMQTPLEKISKELSTLPDPIGRKYCLNFALADGNIVDGNYLSSLFNPDYWMCKITPIHNNNACSINNIKLKDGYKSYLPYKAVEDSLKSAGFDVLVFVPSKDEEDFIITCGNALLGGSTIKR
jgi:23S rRNA (adenine2503-C2)-methyltransferase